MTTQRMKNQWLVVLFLFGVALFNYPLMSLFDMSASVLGIPILYIYLFFIWAVLIVLLIVITEVRRFRPPGDRSS